jgi:hypothetical protein
MMIKITTRMMMVVALGMSRAVWAVVSTPVTPRHPLASGGDSRWEAEGANGFQ